MYTLNIKCLESHRGGGWRAALPLGSACCTLRTFLFTWLNGNFLRISHISTNLSGWSGNLPAKQRQQQATAQRLNQLRSALCSYMSTKQKKVSFVLYVSIATSSVSDTQGKSVFITLLPALFWQIRPAALPLSCVPTLETLAERRWKTAGLACSGEKREPKCGAYMRKGKKESRQTNKQRERKGS